MNRGVAQFGSASALGAGGRRFKSYHPDLINTQKQMEVFTVQEFQERWEEMIERVENGERIGIINDSGQAAVMMSADDELIRIHTEENNEAS